MITIYYTTSKKVDSFLEFQDKFQSENLTLKNFQDLEFTKWQLVKLLEENENIDIFITTPVNFRNDINLIHDVLTTLIFVQKIVTYINHQHLEKSRINLTNKQFQERFKFFDVKGFIIDNIQVINDLTEFQLKRSSEKNNRILPKHTVENILSRDRSRNLVFIRHLIQYLLLNCGGSTVVIGKLMGKDHSTIINSREIFNDYLNLYATPKELYLINQLKNTMEDILSIEHKAPITKLKLACKSN